MAFWNKKKANEEEAEVKKNTSLSDELSDEMRAITEAMEEAKTEKAAKAKEREEENERRLREQHEAEESAIRNASGYVNSVSEEGAVFFMLVTGPADFEPVTPKGILVEGTVYGVAKKGDDVLLYAPDGHAVMNKIEDIRTAPGVHADDASNMQCILELNGDEITEVEKYTVVTNKAFIKPEEDKTAPVANPRLLGLSLDFNRFVKDNEYFATLVNAMVNANFLTKAKMDKANAPDGRARIGLMSLSDPDDPEKRFIPVFTDEVSLAMMNTDPGEKDIQKLSLSFPQLARFSTSAPHSGFVINPFGPVAMKIPSALINDILKSPALSKMIPDDPSSAAPTGPNDPRIQIAIGVPADDAEYRAVSSGIAKYCASEPRIHRAGVVMKMVKGRKEVSFLCIVDCDKGTENDCYRGLFAAAKNGLKKGRKLEFLKYEEAPFADDYFAQEKLIYEE